MPDGCDDTQSVGTVAGEVIYVAVDQNTKYEAAIVVNWLRRCTEDNTKACNCHKCPFDDGVHNCIDYLHSTAADLLKKLAGLKN